MPKLIAPEVIPDGLKPYLFHKLELRWQGTGQAQGECPFCNGSKLYISQDNGLASCKTCDFKGNAFTFLRRLYDESKAEDRLLAGVAAERKIKVETLQRWGLVQSLIDGEWMLPGYKLNGELSLNNLYRWVSIKQKDNTYKRRLLGTTNHNHCLFGVQHWDRDKPDVFIFEGPWDGMKFEEALQLKEEIADHTNIVAVPGCETFKEDWVSPFQDKQVYLCYDSDKPRELKNGKINPPAGYSGMRRSATMLKPVAKSIQILNWGAGGYAADLPDGFDIRDYLLTTLALDA